ncbi:hypothetical protein Cni_G26169 [Canna indica]|uniref:IBH1-like N-terminal domain-containing protein n=1 Tax=Canna indica TaxID=4628 RepID=A0AAQ3L1I5_9LILI|nr:hypothetical protein Cni_G26169 [Canna indica]
MVEKSNKQRWMCLFEPNEELAYAGFSHKYVSYLLPALAKAANNPCSCTRKIKKAILFEVEMALSLAAVGFKWSHALRNKLKHANLETKLGSSPTCHSAARRIDSMSNCIGIVQNLRIFQASSVVPRPLALAKGVSPRTVGFKRGSNENRGSDSEIGRRLRTLRRILPGGHEMNLDELLLEVRSYMVCLQLQVNILRTLVEIH